MAFSIDFEVEEDAKTEIKIHCAALSAVWDVAKVKKDFTELAREMAIQEEECKASSIPLDVNAQDINAIEVYLNRLGCTPMSLKCLTFQEFIEMPSSVESNVKYARDKTFGEKKIEKTVMVHPRYVRRPASTRVFRVNTDRRGGFLLLYVHSNDNAPIQTFKVAANQLTFTLVDTIPNGLSIRSASRLWTLQFQSYDDLKGVIIAINEILKSVQSELIEIPLNKVAAPKETTNASAANLNEVAVNAKEKPENVAITTVNANKSRSPTANANANANINANANKNINKNTNDTNINAKVSSSVKENSNTEAKKDEDKKLEKQLVAITEEISRDLNLNTDISTLREENISLNQELTDLKAQIANLRECIREVKSEKNSETGSTGDITAKIDREIALEKKRYTDIFRIEIHNLKNHIKDLKPLLKVQSAIKNVKVDEKNASKNEENKIEFETDATAKEWEDKIGIDIERKLLQNFETTHGKAQVRFKHIHVHRHQFRHIHNHTHVHLNEESIKETSNIEEKLRHKHTVRHVVTHTNTQYLVPKKWFQR